MLNNAGAYRRVCVDLDLYGLAVCAIMSRYGRYSSYGRYSRYGMSSSYGRYGR